MTGQGTARPTTAELLDRYRGLVERYHGTLDLVSRKALTEFDRYLDEGLRYAALIARLAGPTATVVDVGAGVGLPGVVVAAALPDATVHLVERRRRRAAFLELVVAQLGLGNAAVFGGDVRDLPGVAADVVTAQAVAGLADLVRLTDDVRGAECWLVSRRGEGWRAALDKELGAVLADAGPPAALAASPTAEAEAEPAAAYVVEESLEPHGSLVAIRLPGGSACRSSA